MQTDNEKGMELKEFLMKFGSRLSEKTTNHLSVVYDPLSAASTAMAEEYWTSPCFVDTFKGKIGS